MELPYAQERQKYVGSVRALEVEIKRATEGDDISDVALQSAQDQLDTLAQRYQLDERIGSARYKLYELQALIYYFAEKDSQALDFIDQAIELKGGTYSKAEKIKENLLADLTSKQPEAPRESKMTKSEKRKKLIGLEGWLALFIVGQFLALLITIFRFFADGSLSSSDIGTLNQYQSVLGDTLRNLTAFESLMVIVYAALIVTTLVMLFRRRKAARSFAIATLIFGAVYGILDYSIASAVFGSSGLSQNVAIQTFMNKYAGDVGRSLVGAVLWIPYFIVSRRVKATLVN